MEDQPIYPKESSQGAETGSQDPCGGERDRGVWKICLGNSEIPRSLPLSYSRREHSPPNLVEAGSFVFWRV